MIVLSNTLKTFDNKVNKIKSLAKKKNIRLHVLTLIAELEH